MEEPREIILLHQRLIPAYQVGVLDLLSEKITNLKILYGNEYKFESIRNGSINNDKNYILIRNVYFINQPSYFISTLIPFVIKHSPKIIITQFNLGNINIYFLLLLRSIYKFKLIGWAHGWNRKRGFSPYKSLLDKLRLYLFNKANAIILYNYEAKEKLSKFISKDKIFVAPNTLDTNRLFSLLQRLQYEGRQKIKKRIGFTSLYNIIFIGRLEPSKNPLKLLSLFQALQKLFTDISLHIIGDGPEYNELKETVDKNAIKDVNLYGDIYDYQRTGEMLYASDLMIIPSAAGLAIIHSLCFKCPVVILSENENGPEIEYLVNNENSFLLYDSSDIEILKTIIDYFNDSERQLSMREKSLKTVKSDASVQKFIEGFLDSINYVSNR